MADGPGGPSGFGTCLREKLAEPLPLTCGRTLPVEVVFETYGDLSPARDNAVLVLHGLTADHHAAGAPRAEGGKSGWWDAAIGPGKALDTDRLCVICPNVVGGAASTGPSSIDPATGRPYGLTFPVVTVADMVAAQIKLADALGIGRFHTVIGGCLGGFQVLEWLARAPERVDRAVVISATAKTSAHNTALWAVLRAAILSDPAFNDGQYGNSQPAAGLGLLAMTGALFWMSRETLESRFGTRTVDGKAPRYTLEPDFAIEALLNRVRENAAQGHLDANSLIYLTRAIDYFDMARDHGSLETAFRDVTSPLLLVSYASDWRYPTEEMAEIAAAMPDGTVQHEVLESPLGHGAFIYEFQTLAPLLTTFMAAPVTTR